LLPGKHHLFDEVDGSILDARLAVTWRMNPYLVFVLGYRSFTIDIDSRDESDPGMVDMRESVEGEGTSHQAPGS
jgi:hypothetical protein